MNKYVIMMDVSGDVCPETLKKWDLKFIPMQYSLGEEMRTSYGPEDSEVLKRFYDGQRTGDLTKTSQITPFQYEEYFEPYLKEGYSVLYLCLSSGLSSTFSAACLAKDSLKEKYPDLDVFPVDSLAATGGMGVLIEEALKNRELGLNVEENYNQIISLVPRIKNWFLVQDLNYLKRGGRISSTTAIFGTMLNIKPILKIDEKGKLTTIGKKRGNKMAVNELVELFSTHYDSTASKIVYICNADCPDLGDLLAEKLLEKYPDLEIKQATLSPIIGAHTGPGMLILSHIGK